MITDKYNRRAATTDENSGPMRVFDKDEEKVFLISFLLVNCKNRPCTFFQLSNVDFGLVELVSFFKALCCTFIYHFTVKQYIK